MFDRPSVGQRAARVAAIVCSLGLFTLVVLNAQLGCDSPTTTPPPSSSPSPSKNTSAEPPPALVETNPAPASEPPASEAPPAPNPEPEPEPDPKPPVFMPASKSGGDFGSMQFPGELQGVPTQQANPAPSPR